MEDKIIRCSWAESDPFSMEYHDKRWCKPCHDERELFKMLILEGFQAGLSWATILKKEAAFVSAFDGFDPKIIACYDQKKIDSLIENPQIIRNKRKIEATITNVEKTLKLGSLNNFFWSFTDGKVIDNHLMPGDKLPANSPLSDKVSSELKGRGFKFVGSTIIYSYLQAIGIINDHFDCCKFKY
jgi:DNA-3-methyladenine glycosylase I